MRLLRSLRLICFLAFPLLVTAQSAPATSEKQPSSDNLYRTIEQLDRELFAAIDRCDMKTEASFWSEDAEFYHDKDGLMIGGAKIVEAIKNNLCGKVKRELVPGTLEVYPIAGYGAVEIGVHRFLHPWAQDNGVIGGAKFIHVWRYQDGRWKITRVISVDHHEAK